MRSVIPIVVMLCVMIICAGTVSAQQKNPADAMARGLVETVAKGCQKELAKFSGMAFARKIKRKVRS